MTNESKDYERDLADYRMSPADERAMQEQCDEDEDACPICGAPMDLTPGMSGSCIRW